MKALITKISYKGAREGKFGTEHNFVVNYDGKTAYYTSKVNPQNKFIEGAENEFTEVEGMSKTTGNKYYTIKPIQKGGMTGYAKEIKKEQSKYSGFAMSYAKDLVVAGKIDLKDMFGYAIQMIDWMVEQDKAIAND